MKKKEKNDQTQISLAALDRDFQNVNGKIPYNMTNDYMFRAVLQSNNKVLRGLICSLLHLAESEVNAVEITNPIILGETVNDKEFRLDINIIMNNSVLINLEMQITNKLNWENRSVMYLCRSYDKLNRGQDYREARPAIHISFLDYTLFDEYPEFYASYKLINVKSHQKYSDNLTMYVVDLSRINLATEEDKQYHIHDWAYLFKAATWEELKMIASKDEYLKEASQTIFRMSADEEIRKRCRDREEYYQDMRNYERAIAEKEEKIERDRKEHEEDMRNYERAIAEKEEKIERDRKEHEEDLRNYRNSLAERDARIQQLQAELEMLRKQNKYTLL
ncbi:MAG: Rpn family recombination-promoting nuclease/putative transposase [Lachnospiraceae bacterium]|nr:Rpn family recombination-promoting nuclease/putative transposase [Lachnospiraceae bacterium]